MRAWCDYCDNGCERCQPSEQPSSDYDYSNWVDSEKRRYRKLLRAIKEYLDYVEECIPDMNSIPPITHTISGENIAESFRQVEVELQYLKSQEDREAENARRKRERDLEALQAESKRIEQRLREAKAAVARDRERNSGWRKDQ